MSGTMSRVTGPFEHCHLVTLLAPLIVAYCPHHTHMKVTGSEHCSKRNQFSSCFPELPLAAMPAAKVVRTPERQLWSTAMCFRDDIGAILGFSQVTYYVYHSKCALAAESLTECLNKLAAGASARVDDVGRLYL
jgi:hypothetical protein